MKRTLVLVTLAVTVTALLATTAFATGKKEAAVAAPTELIGHFIGDVLPDQEMVWEEVNRRLRDDINVTLQVNNIPWADYSQRYNLLLASGEYIDTVYTGNWMHYAESALRNAFMEIDLDQVRTHMPDYYAKLPSTDWDQVRVGGRIYMIPYTNRVSLQHNLVMIRGDLREKYGMPPLRNNNDLVDFMLAVAEHEDDLIAYNTGIGLVTRFINMQLYKQPNELMLLNPPLFAVSLTADNPEVMYVLDDPRYHDVLRTAKTLYDAGAIPRNTVLQTEDYLPDSGLGAVGVHHYSHVARGYLATMTENPEFKPEVMDLQPNVIHESNSVQTHGMAIGGRSRHADKVMQMLNLFHTNRDYYDLTWYGIEGVHWEPVGDREYAQLDGASGYPGQSFNAWGWESSQLNRKPADVPDFIIDFPLSWAERGVLSTSPIASFAFDDSRVRTQVAAVVNTYQTRGYRLISGDYADLQRELELYRNELRQAGIERVKEELQRQLTEYFTSF